MGRAKKRPKTGGRQKGTPNRSSLYVRAELAAARINLVERFLAEVAQLDKPEDRVAEYHKLFRYVFPTLKEIEGPDDRPPPPRPPAPSPFATIPASQLSTEELEEIAKKAP